MKKAMSMADPARYRRSCGTTDARSGMREMFGSMTDSYLKWGELNA